MPHSEIHGSKTACVSPWLIAACRVLPRLPPPRHPPCARTAWAPNPWRPARAARGNRAASVLASGARTRWARPAVLLLVGSLYSLSARARFCQERGRAAGCQRDRRGDGRAGFRAAPGMIEGSDGGCPSVENGGAEGTRTHDILLAKQALYQLSYGPSLKSRGKERDFSPHRKEEPPRKVGAVLRNPIPAGNLLLPCPGASPGTGQRNATCLTWRASADGGGTPRAARAPAPWKGGDPAAGSPTATLLRLHPSHRHLLGRLAAASVDAGFHDVTGGVYKARERIQGAVADAPLLAIPTSCSRVADCSPNWGRLWGSARRRRLASHCTGHCSTFAAPGVGAIRT